MGSYTTHGSLVETALAEARNAYAKRNPESQRHHNEGQAYMPGGNTRTILHVTPFSLTFASGQGAELTSVDGDTYIDLLGEYSAGIFGHSNPKIKEAVIEALSKGWNYGGQCTYEKELAKKVVDRFEPSGIEHVRFTNSGTESNTMAIAAAVNFTGRRKILVFSGGYHGGTLIFSMEFMKNPDVLNSNLPHDFVFAPFNNVEETKAVIAGLPKDSLAAILVEPLQGSGGCRRASREFLHFLRQQAIQLGALFIADEVMASRLGVHGYCSTVGVRADIVTLGKYVGGGMTFGAFGGRRDVMALFDPSKGLLQHPGTYNNNVVTMAAGVVGLDIYNSKAVDGLNRLGVNAKVALQQVLVKHEIYPDYLSAADSDIVEVDSFKTATTLLSQDGVSKTSKDLPRMFIAGQGSMLNVRFSGEERATWQALFYHHLLTKNIYVAPRGYTPFHLALTEKHIDRYVVAVEEFVVKYKEALS